MITIFQKFYQNMCKSWLKIDRVNYSINVGIIIFGLSTFYRIPRVATTV